MSEGEPADTAGLGDVAGLFDVAGKTAVITGGTRGIGLMIARGLLASGARVIISSRKQDACDAAIAELGALGQISAIAADLSTAAGVAALAGHVAEQFNRVDILVNNAGATWGASLDEFPISAFEKVLTVNVTAVFAVTQALLPLLRAGAAPESPARVINVGSIDGIGVSSTENYSYGASKSAVHMLTRKLAADLAAESITVNAIAPGPFPTKMLAYALDDEQLRTQIETSVPLGRIGSAKDIVGAVIFLASRAGAFLTATIIPVDGGLSGTR